MRQLLIFLNNIRYLFRYNLKALNQNINQISENLNSELANVQYAIDHIPFEIEKDLKKIHKYQVKDKLETLKTLSTSNLSIARFGDGELDLLMGKNILCQKFDEKLKAKLEKTLSSKSDKLMIGIPEPFVSYFGNEFDIKRYDRQSYGRTLPYIMQKFLSEDIKYYSAGVSFEYIHSGSSKTNEYYDYYYSMYRAIWNNKDIVIVCGDRVFNYLDYSIYDNAKSIEYVYCKTNNAFEDYDSIIHKIKTYSKDKIIILMLGPTATVLAMDLSEEGYRAIDIGHIAKDYDAYKKELPANVDNLRIFFDKE